MNGDNTDYRDVPIVEPVEPTGSLEDGVLLGHQYSADTGGTKTTLTYSFPDENSFYSLTSYPTNGRPWPQDGLDQLSAYGRTLFEEKLAFVERITNIEFVQLEDSGTQAGTIRPAWMDGTNVSFSGYADAPMPNQGSSGDIWFSRAILGNEYHQEFDRITTHELGHALGLKHPHEVRDGFPTLDTDWLGREYTIMSYTNSLRHPGLTQADLHPQTFMYMDILALQHMYGVNTATTGGNDTYNFDLTERHYLTVWDFGGSDTISITGGNIATKIDLTPGSWSNVGTTVHYHDGLGRHEYESRTLFITPETTIENAHGAGGNDQLIGNQAANYLKGNSGSDTLLGGTGNDTLSGGGQDDMLQGNAGNDQLWAGPGDMGDDTMLGGAGQDVVGGGDGDDFLAGGLGGDILYGGSGNDTLIGGGWTDTVNTPNDRFDEGEADLQELAANQIWGGDGHDLIIAAAGDDRIGAASGDDTIEAGSGNNLVFAGAGTDRIVTGDGDDTIFGGPGNDSIIGGAGADILWGGSGDDSLSGGAGADIFSFTGTIGQEIVSDFNMDEDTLNIAGVSSENTEFAETDTGLLITLGDGGTILLVGLTESDASHFDFLTD